MCWISNSKPTIKVAERDIPIFKVCVNMLDKVGCVRSYYWNYVYSLNREYCALAQGGVGVLESTFLDDEYRICVGFHSYGGDTTSLFRSNWNVLFIESTLGVITFYCNTDKIVRVNGYIPKGSMYAVNERGEYVSDRIVLTEIKDI